MKIVTVVGARPQFIKAAVVSRILCHSHQEVLVHTGQHYDYHMSQQIFDELDIPIPKYNLAVNGLQQIPMLAQMMIKIGEVLEAENPDMVLVYGDTNSTLAAALTANRMCIPVTHVEAGPRDKMLYVPERVNRVCTDHVSALLLACTQWSMECLKKEGLHDRAFLVGDPMYDAFLQNCNKKKYDELQLEMLDGTTYTPSGSYYYLTCHHSDDLAMPEALEQILNAMEQLPYPTIYPVHPRNTEKVHILYNKNKYCNIVFVQPVGYFESLALVKNAKHIITDSGGIQREAFFAKVPCLTVYKKIAWPETAINGCNVSVIPDTEEILFNVNRSVIFPQDYYPFGDGSAGINIVARINAFFEEIQ